MSTEAGMEQGPEGDDFVAAEYVLGVQAGPERAATAARIEGSRDFAGLVDRWEVRLAPLGAAYVEVDPPARVKQAIDRLLFSGSSTQREPGAGWWRSLALWRGVSFAAIAALAAVIVIPMVNPPAPVPQERMVASLSADNSDVHYMAMYDAATHEVGLSHVSGERAEGRDFELWMIDGNQAPVSLGVIPQGATARMVMPDELAAKMAQGAVFAISLEPTGGSPTGAPTGPVVAAGNLTDI